MDNKKVKLGRVGRMNLKKLISKHPRRSEINSKKSLSHWKTCELIDFCVQLGIDFTQYISSRQPANSLANSVNNSTKSNSNNNNVNRKIVANQNNSNNNNINNNNNRKVDPIAHHLSTTEVVKEEAQIRNSQHEEKNIEIINGSILDSMSQLLLEQSELLTMSFSLTINVNILIGRNSVDFLMDDQSTILEIKERIVSLYDAPLCSLHLLHNNHFVNDDVKILNLASNLYLQLRLITSITVHYNTADGSDRVLKCFNSCCVSDIQRKICEIEEISQCKLFLNDIDISNAQYEIGSIIPIHSSNCYSLSVILRVIYFDNFLDLFSNDYYLNLNHSNPLVDDVDELFSFNSSDCNNLFDSEVCCYFNS